VAETNHDKALFERVATMLRIQGIISIVFGSLGVIFGLVLMFMFGLGMLAYENITDYAVENFVWAVITFVFVVIPHVYLIVAGTILIRQPTPGIARTLTIINLVVGALSNLVVLIFAIICLTQTWDYERHYPKNKK
jgi:hypothetical protein